jgi:hypothetical protein
MASSMAFAADVPRAAAQPAPAASAPAHDVPVYRTRMPPPLTVSYRLRRGNMSGSGSLQWQPAGDRYRTKLEGSVLGFRVLTWASEGAIDANGIAPVRFTDDRRGKSQQVANFQRAAGRITYGSRPDQYPLVPGAQDRLTWMVQIAAVALADPHRLDPNARVSFFVSGARGDGDVWSFQVLGPQAVTTPAGTVQAVKLLREPRKPNDTKVEVWLDPARHYLPARARMTSGDNDVFELLLEELQPAS